MRSRSSLFSTAGAVALAVLMCLPAASVLAEETDELTPAAATAVKTLFPSATVIDVGQEREQGVLYYEVAVRDGNERIEVEVTPDGSVGEIESVVAMEDVPQAAREEILWKTRGVVVRQVEKHEVRGTPQDGTFAPLNPAVILYEVEYESHGRTREFVVAEDGGPPPFGARGEEEEDDDSEEDSEEDAGD